MYYFGRFTLQSQKARHPKQPHPHNVPFSSPSPCTNSLPLPSASGLCSLTQWSPPPCRLSLLCPACQGRLWWGFMYQPAPVSTGAHSHHTHCIPPHTRRAGQVAWRAGWEALGRGELIGIHSPLRIDWCNTAVSLSHHYIEYVLCAYIVFHHVVCYISISFYCSASIAPIGPLSQNVDDIAQGDLMRFTQYQNKPAAKQSKWKNSAWKRRHLSNFFC